MLKELEKNFLDYLNNQIEKWKKESIAAQSTFFSLRLNLLSKNILDTIAMHKKTSTTQLIIDTVEEKLMYLKNPPVMYDSATVEDTTGKYEIELFLDSRGIFHIGFNHFGGKLIESLCINKEKAREIIDFLSIYINSQE